MKTKSDGANITVYFSPMEAAKVLAEYARDKGVSVPQHVTASLSMSKPFFGGDQDAVITLTMRPQR